MWKKDKENTVELTVCNAEYNKRVCKTRVVYSEDGKTRTEMWAYRCERCLTEEEAPYNIEAAKETFDYFYMSGSILCPQCRVEMEKFKNNAYKLRTIFVYGHQNGDMCEDIEDVYPNLAVVEAKIEEYEKESMEKSLSMGFYVKDKCYFISYIPYAERKG